ncbi:tetratricopeptide repeat protein [Geminocystis sp. GBBB08]|uniref:tetratricopeptide repeat protein n=1 Tax=Geminocystis sp. GBBB08 TaxID=2604140 RepID=UPI0027E34492|nr:tetratricopeptide repeat protein [Geminocystis sp. GBBB08]MBL1210090.1 tetratricopeptide repeat protein [Geminocystis sp. GBBB08]
MFEEVNLAINNENYTKAKEILKKLEKDNNSLWIKYYHSLILEKEGNLKEAESNYRQTIKDSIYPEPNLIKLIRDGIERIVKIYHQEKEEKFNQFKTIENSEDLAVLVLEPVTLDDKKILAPKLANIINIDNYTATLQIPTRSWRLYKTGNLGELNYWQSEFSQVNIPCFCERIKNINKIEVYQVKYIIQDDDEVIILGDDDDEKEQEIIFKWGDINNKVQGLIPIFELILHLDARSKPQKKKSILDYRQFYDLHLLSQNLILRFSDNFYKFDQGLNITNQEKTSKKKRQVLVHFFAEKLSDKPLWSDFTLFAQGVILFPEMLKQVDSHINLFHREENIWDEAFQLYSGLIFLQSLTKLEPYINP